VVARLSQTESTVSTLEEALVAERRRAEASRSSQAVALAAASQLTAERDELKAAVEVLRARLHSAAQEHRRELTAMRDRSQYLPTVEVRRMQEEWRREHHEQTFGPLLSALHALQVASEACETGQVVGRSAMMAAVSELERCLAHTEASMVALREFFVMHEAEVEAGLVAYVRRVTEENRQLYGDLTEMKRVCGEQEAALSGMLPADDAISLQQYREDIAIQASQHQSRLQKAQELIHNQTLLIRQHEEAMEEMVGHHERLTHTLETLKTADMHHVTAQQEAARLLLRAAVFVRLHTAEVNKKPTATEPNSPTKKSASIRSGDGRGGPLAWVLGLTLLTIVAALQSTVFTESSLPIPLRYMRSSSSSSRGMIPEAGLAGACLVIILDVLWRSFGSPAGIAEAAAAAKLLQLAASTGTTAPPLRAPLAADAVREELLTSLATQIMSLRALIDEVVVVGASSASSATSTPGASSAPDRLALARVSVVLREVEREMLPRLTRQQLVQFKESTEGPRRRLTLALSSLRVGVLPEAVSSVTEGGVVYPVYELPPPIPHTDTRRVTSPTHLSMAIAFCAPLSVLLSLPPQLLGTITTTSDAAYYRSCALAVPWLYAVYLLLQLSAAHHDVPLLHPVQNLLIDGVFDLCHVGHKKHMKAALDHGRSGGQRGGGQQLYVGVCGDETCVGYKRLPIMNTAERVREVQWCGFAVDVIPNYPVDGTLSEILAYYPIHRMLCGEEYQKPGDHYYAVPRLLGMLDTTPRTKGISSSDIVSRMERRQTKAQA